MKMLMHAQTDALTDNGRQTMGGHIAHIEDIYRQNGWLLSDNEKAHEAVIEHNNLKIVYSVLFQNV